VKFAITEPITQETVNKVLELVLVSKSNRRDDNLFIYINSPGGDVDAGYAIYELLRLSGKRVVTYAVNQVYSCAVLLYLAGDYRFANNHSTFMIHEPYHELPNEMMTRKVYKANMDELDECVNGFFSVICERSNLTMEKIRKAILKAPEGDWYIKLEQAMKLGIVHDIGLP
jgi:ATP-dependent Clp protease protease subunit